MVRRIVWYLRSRCNIITDFLLRIIVHNER